MRPNVSNIIIPVSILITLGVIIILAIVLPLTLRKKKQSSNITTPSIIKYTAISAGTSHSLGLTENGQIIGWGKNDDKQLDIPILPPDEKWIDLFAGFNNSFGLTNNGKLIGWGDNIAGQTNVPLLN